MKIKKAVSCIIIGIIAVVVLNATQDIVERAYSVKNRDAAIATVNGGDAAFIEQQAIKSGGRIVNSAFNALYIATLVFVGWSLYGCAKKD